jgi:membrane-associated phospholipid phosphatase
MDQLYQFGISIIQSLQTFSPALDGFMTVCSFMGGIGFFLIFIPFIYWTIDRRIGVRALLILLSFDFITASFKLLFHQPRPYWIGDVKQLSTETTYGIPSSHAGRSLSVIGYLAFRIKENWFWAVTVIYVLLVGISRLYLGVHFPHDVLFGWLIGIVVLWAFIKWESAFRNWLIDKPLSTQIALGFTISLMFIATGSIIRLMIAGTPDPEEWSQYSTEARSLVNFFTLAGAFFGTWAGYPLMRQYASFDAKGPWGKRALRYFVGVIGLLVIYLGLSLLFDLFAPDESVPGYILRYIRYSLVAFWAIFLAPWVFIKFNLADTEA